VNAAAGRGAVALGRLLFALLVITTVLLVLYAKELLQWGLEVFEVLTSAIY